MAARNRWFWPTCFSVMIEFMRDENISWAKLSDQACGRGAAKLALKQRDTIGDRVECLVVATGIRQIAISSQPRDRCPLSRW